MAFSNFSMTPKKGARDRTNSQSKPRVDSVFGTPTPPSPTMSEPAMITQIRIDEILSNAAAAQAQASALNPTAPPWVPAAQYAGGAAANVVENPRALLGHRAYAEAPPSIQETHLRLHMAQMENSPRACIFVGNLPNYYPDGILTLIVREEYKRVGQCWVGIFRDYPWMPYAIVQFEEDHHATRAKHRRVRVGRVWRAEYSRRA